MVNETDDRKKPKVSPFRLASREPAVVAEIGVDDVLEARPGWTRQQAEAWLRRNAEPIGRVMLLSGVGEMLRRIGGPDDA